MDDNNKTSSSFPPLMTTTEEVADDASTGEKKTIAENSTAEPSAISVSVNTATDPVDNSDATKTEETSTTEESRVDKVRKAKIAMEGFGRTVQRETEEKEEKASAEKNELYKVLDSISHEKEILELTWVNIDDKRTRLKKLLDPVLAREEKIENDEQQLESLEQVTTEAAAKHELEGKRWKTQELRKKLEEEKWLVEEKILKFNEQIEENKKKYQELISQEDKVKQKLKDIDEKLILQAEVLRQQRELEEEKIRQEALNKIQADRQKTEMEKRRLEELKKAENEKKEAEERRIQEEKNKAGAEQRKVSEQVRFEELRKKEEEKQRQETERKVKEEQDRMEELKKKIATSASAASTPIPINVAPKETQAEDPLEKIKELELAQRQKEQAEASRAAEIERASGIKIQEQNDSQIERAKELERVKRENEEADYERQEKERERIKNIDNVGNPNQAKSLLDEIKKEGGELKPLRTLKGDTVQAYNENAITEDDLNKLDRKKFPWLS